MSDPATPARAGEIRDGGAAAGPLTPDRIDAVLADFRGWLTELGGDGRRGQAPPLAAPAPVDLASVVAQVTALRHEVNLQTKASRAAVEQTAEALKSIATAKPATDIDEAVRPLIKALVDIADALAIGLKQTEKVRDGLAPMLEELEHPPGLKTWGDRPDKFLTSAPAAEPPRRGLLGRLFGTGQGSDTGLRDLTSQMESLYRKRWERGNAVIESIRQSIAGLADGYAMSLRRIERVLPQFGLEPVECVGRPFDPELMEAVEAVDGDDQPSGTVVEEVRRGYRWHGKPFRFAQVKVAR